MPSFQIAIEPNRRAAARFVGQVRRSLQKAFVEEQKKRGLSQSEIARMLKVHRSVINRELKGLKDMTLGRVAELAWAMDRKAVIELKEVAQVVGQNIDAEQRAPETEIDYSIPEQVEEPPTPDYQFELAAY
jgi:hypothetical protein